ncbi:MAG TPA: glycoside hydrolase family 2 TIM barrel-domain containing protein, partial [Opitutaceae bacterium]
PVQRDREELALDIGWKFVRQDVPSAMQRRFNDADWKSIDLPHTWNAEDATSPNYYRGPAWYRLHFNLPTHLVGRDLYLYFGAASTKASVYANGEFVGEHRGGYSAFCFEATHHLHIGENVIAVRVDNSPDPDITPLSGDFTIYGGLYRSVYLLALNSVAISPIDDASSGIYITPKVENGQAQIVTISQIRNTRTAVAPVVIKTTLFDGAHHEVGSTSFPKDIAPEKTQEIYSKIDLTTPHVWNGAQDPYLYTARVQVIEGDTVVDTVEQSFGIRAFEVSATHGLMLNGHQFDLHGVNYHQGRLSTGYADTDEMKSDDFKLITELGATGVRFCHYQHAPEDYTLCDQLGLVAWAELGLVNKITDSPAFSENCERQLRELIKQNYNHPSILFWSLYNEPWVKPEMLEAQTKLVTQLVVLTHSLDPLRLVTGAQASGNDADYNRLLDLTAINRYYGWYGEAASEWGTHLAALAEKYPNRKVGISEYGAGASINQHESNPTQPKPASRWHPEEWQAIVHENAWAALSQHEEIWCKFVWVMFDFASSGRTEGDRDGINDKGLVAADHKTRKDAFYFYKAAWNSAPFVYITDRRFSPRPAATSTLKVYSSCPTVELYIDGQLLSQRTSTNHIFRWPDVDLPIGEHHLKAVASVNGKSFTDEIAIQVTPADQATP